MRRDTELTIIERVQAGDTAAFARLVEKYQQPLFTLVANFLYGSHRVEDTVQDVFLAAYQSIRSYHPSRGRFSTWLYRIARNRCLNERRKKREHPVPDLPDSPGPDDPSRTLLEKEVFQKLDQALASLPERDRRLFILAELQDLSYSEISDIEGVKIGTVKSRLSRARVKLRAILKEFKE